MESKEPIVYHAHPKDVYLCPCCGSTFIERNGILMRFCNNCGQAIKEKVDG